MSSPYLVVPIQVQAMVLANSETTLFRGVVNYGNLSVYSDPSPTPLAQTPNTPLGVYVSWTLPAALRASTRQPDGSMPYPLVPNRWLVSKLVQSADAAAPTASYWIVQSDYLDSGQGTVPYLDPTESTLTPTRLGRAVSISATSPWSEPTVVSAPFLTAVAEANPYFAAFQPSNANVFSFFDPLGAAPAAACTVSYYVIGWYSDSASDILANSPDGTLATLLSNLNWTADGTLPAMPVQSIYQGAAYSVPWNPDGQAFDPGSGITSNVAVGNTSIDGIVCMAETALGGPTVQAAVEAAEVLEAFVYDLLPSVGVPGGEPLIDEQVRQRWYSSIPGETTYVIVDAPSVPGATRAPVTAAERAAEQAWLVPLNESQALVDRCTRELVGLRRQLYSLWWKSGAAFIASRDPINQGQYPYGTSAREFTVALELLAPAVAALEGLLDVTQPLVPTATATVPLLTAISNFASDRGLPATRLLKIKTGDRFWTSTDPVVVVSNTAALPPAPTNTPLACRWLDELATGITVDGPNGAIQFDGTQFGALQPAPPTANLPSSVAQLFAELFLFDTANAPMFAANMTADEVDTLASSMVPPVPSNAGAFAPAINPPYPWVAPWNPLFLDWSVSWFDIPFSNWQFNGTDYVLPAAVSSAFTPSIFIGRSALTPKPAFDLDSSIAQYLQNYPSGPLSDTLQSVQADLEGWTLLSQRLGGLQTQIAGWSAAPTQFPEAGIQIDGIPLAQLVGSSALVPPNPQQGNVASTPASTYEGMRAGQFFLNQVAIVDSFGQVLAIVDAPVADGPSLPFVPSNNDPFVPDTGLGVTPSAAIDFPTGTLVPSGSFVELPPRLLQPARLNFDFIAGGQRFKDNPILGWILPNHIDSSLAVYGPAGEGFGELIRGVNASNAASINWLPAPNSPYATLPDSGPAPQGLLGFLAGLQAAGAGALADFLAAVDETLWTTDPLGARADAFLSVLVGRPLAIVGASLSLELQSAPWSDPDWPFTFTDTPPLFLSHTFPVRLGDLGCRDDGLLGYFTEGVYSCFNAVKLPKGTLKSDYLQAIGPATATTAANFVNLQFASHPIGTPVALTMIVDPRGSVHARCGLFPVKAVALESKWVDQALDAIQITLRTGPSLAGAGFTTAATPVAGFTIPRPGERKGTWSWQEYDCVSSTWSSLALLPVDSAAHLADQPPTLREGRLTLTGGLAD